MRSTDTASGSHQPPVTLVVAMRNESANIERCLASIANQDYPASLIEVLVYDGESTDASVAIAQAFASGREGWAVLPNPRRIQAAAWNAGIRAARGQVIGIASAHSELGPGYIRCAVEALRQTGADMVGGPVRTIAEEPVARAIAIALSTPFGVGGARHHYVTRREVVDTVFMGVCRRETWLRFPFDETMVRNQDDELSYRLLDAGGIIVCDPAIEVAYRNRSSLADLWEQYFDYGRWKVRVLRAHPRQTRLRHLAPLGLVATLGLGLALAPLSRAARAAVTLETLLYGASTAAAAVRYRDRQRRGSGPLLLLAYPILHLSYGLGMVDGLLRLAASLIRRPAHGAGQGDVGAVDSTVTRPPHAS